MGLGSPLRVPRPAATGGVRRRPAPLRARALFGEHGHAEREATSRHPSGAAQWVVALIAGFRCAAKRPMEARIATQRAPATRAGSHRGWHPVAHPRQPIVFADFLGYNAAWESSLGQATGATLGFPSSAPAAIRGVAVFPGQVGRSCPHCRSRASSTTVHTTCAGRRFNSREADWAAGAGGGGRRGRAHS